MIDFYDCLSSLIRTIPKHNLIVGGGDFNAELGMSQYHRFTYHQTTNRNGEYLEHFILENGLKLLTLAYKKRKENSGRSHILVDTMLNWTTC